MRRGTPAAKMKHGPIALSIPGGAGGSIAMPGSVFDKVLSNAQEAKAAPNAQLDRCGGRPGPDPSCSIVCCRAAVDELL